MSTDDPQVPQPSTSSADTMASEPGLRKHRFTPTFSGTCSVCRGGETFGEQLLRCYKCHSTVHTICQDFLSISCSPVLIRQTSRNQMPSALNGNAMAPRWYSTEISKLSSHSREHSFASEIVWTLKMCAVCRRRIGIGKTALKCRNYCRLTVHTECKDSFEILCLPAQNIRTHRGELLQGDISDYAPLEPPFVPSLVIRCIRQIESRVNRGGRFSYANIVRSTEAKSLTKEYLINKTLRSLSTLDLDTIASILILFLESLSEPLIIEKLRNDFVTASLRHNQQWKHKGLRRAISKLPLPNRDTLAYLIHHLQRITVGLETIELKKNLAGVFGPIVVGESSRYLPPNLMIFEQEHPTEVVTSLLEIYPNYWTDFLHPYPQVIDRIKNRIEKFLIDRRDREIRESSLPSLAEEPPERRSFSRFFNNPRDSIHRLIRRNETGRRSIKTDNDDE